MATRAELESAFRAGRAPSWYTSQTTDTARRSALSKWLASPGVPAIWIAPTGSDGNSGTEASPLASLTTAINWASSGDIIMVKGGTYTPSALIDVYKSNLTIIAAPGAVPIFDAINYATPGTYNDRVIRLQGVSNVTIDGLRFTRGPDGGMQIIGACSNIAIRRCHFYANGRRSVSEGQGLYVGGSSSNVKILRCDSYENYDALGTPAGSNADGFQISSTGTGNGLYECRAWRNSDDGYDFFNTDQGGGVTVAPVEVVGCWAWENGILAGGSDSLGDGNGFKLGGQNAGIGNGSGGNVVSDCLAWANREIGFTDNSCTVANRLQNSTAYNNRRINIEGGTPAHTIRNCIAYVASESNVSISTTTNVTNNSWQLLTVANGDFRSLTDTDAKGSRREDGALPVTSFLELAPSSRMVRAGLDVGVSYVPPTPDLGAK